MLVKLQACHGLNSYSVQKGLALATFNWDLLFSVFLLLQILSADGK